MRDDCPLISDPIAKEPMMKNVFKCPALWLALSGAIGIAAAVALADGFVAAAGAAGKSVV